MVSSSLFSPWISKDSAQRTQVLDHINLQQQNVWAGELAWWAIYLSYKNKDLILILRTYITQPAGMVVIDFCNSWTTETDTSRYLGFSGLLFYLSCQVPGQRKSLSQNRFLQNLKRMVVEEQCLRLSSGFYIQVYTIDMPMPLYTCAYTHTHIPTTPKNVLINANLQGILEQHEDS